MNKQRLIRISHYQNHLYCMLYFSWVCDQTLSLLILFLAINTNLFCRTPPPPKHIQQKTYFCNKRFIYASQYIYVKNYAGEILYSLTTLRNYRIISIVPKHNPANSRMMKGIKQLFSDIFMISVIYCLGATMICIYVSYQNFIAHHGCSSILSSFEFKLVCCFPYTVIRFLLTH